MIAISGWFIEKSGVSCQQKLGIRVAVHAWTSCTGAGVQGEHQKFTFLFLFCLLKIIKAAGRSALRAAAAPGLVLFMLE
jgi:hypothetical protein